MGKMMKLPMYQVDAFAEAPFTGNPAAVVPLVRHDAHRIIEECMLAANVATARFFEDCGLPILYRVHEGPKADKLSDLREFLGELGLDLPGGVKPTPLHYQQLLEQAIGQQLVLMRQRKQDQRKLTALSQDQGYGQPGSAVDIGKSNFYHGCA